MNPWYFHALDVCAAILAVAGITLIVRAMRARRLTFAERVAQGRVLDEAPPQLTQWARRVGASALDSLGSTRESVARRLILAGKQPEISVFRLRQACAGIAGMIGACLALTARPAASLRASIIPLIV
ncbi:MAG: type II secretion system protein F, partial [Pauljensenia sp.]